MTQFNLDDYIRTREGRIVQWPVDPDTRRRLERLRHGPLIVKEPTSVWVYALAISFGVSVIVFGIMYLLSGGVQ